VIWGDFSEEICCAAGRGASVDGESVYIAAMSASTAGALDSVTYVTICNSSATSGTFSYILIPNFGAFRSRIPDEHQLLDGTQRVISTRTGLYRPLTAHAILDFMPFSFTTSVWNKLDVVGPRTCNLINVRATKFHTFQSSASLKGNALLHKTMRRRLTYTDLAESIIDEHAPRLYERSTPDAQVVMSTSMQNMPAL
jgi:hypothetical protein